MVLIWDRGGGMAPLAPPPPRSATGFTLRMHQTLKNTLVSLPQPIEAISLRHVMQ